MHPHRRQFLPFAEPLPVIIQAMGNDVQDELVEALADETTHLRAELNAVKAELQMVCDELQRIALASLSGGPRVS